MSALIALIVIFAIFSLSKSLIRFLIQTGITFIIFRLFKRLFQVTVALILIAVLIDYIS